MPQPDYSPWSSASRYFMLRVGAVDGPAELAGLIELLGVGEKRVFASTEEMIRHLREWLEVQTGRQPSA